jgi:hypothetical protein
MAMPPLAKIDSIPNTGADCITSRERANQKLFTQLQVIRRLKMEDWPMRKIFIASIAAAFLALSAPPASAGERTITGAAIGAGAGALVAGPVGAVVGGGIGAVVGGPRISHRHRHCWRDNRGHRHCHWR